MSLVLQSSGGGSVTLTEPVTTANTSLTVPAVNGGVAVTTNDVLGYYTGLGGTVTQLTSKATAVTLDKPTGQITMNSAALAGGTAVAFVVNNSSFSMNDAVIVNIASSIAGPTIYSVQASDFIDTQFRISLRNNSGTSLSNAVVLNFAIIKGATS